MNRRKFIAAAAVGAVGLGAIYWPSRWRYIVIHHSAGQYATIEFLQQVHRDRQAGDPIDAIPYHYVIGNGNGLGMGEIASDWRMKYDIWGAHVSARNATRNFLGLGICLVGNFEEVAVPKQQYEALVVLTRNLMDRYSISTDRVYGHGLIPGENTKCPGKHFPFAEFKAAITMPQSPRS